jgi:acyl CoA:acetate/3-ketoacid CoA transferase alpha subunit
MPVPAGQAANQGKVMPLERAVRTLVRPRDVVLAAYTEARPNAALMQLARTFAGTDPQLTLVTAGMVSVQHALVELGIVSKVVASFIGENYPSARPSPSFQRALTEGRVTVENWSMWGLLARLVAGGLGVPLMPVRSIAGSSMEQENKHAFTEIADPFGGTEPVHAVSALHPDIAVVHAVAADASGNLLLSAPYGEAHWGCLAARRGVIATVEAVVDPAVIKANNALVRVPGHVVRAVCPAPLGSHPYGLFNPGVAGVDHYVDDNAFMSEVRAAAASPGTFRTWIDEWILGVSSHDGYLAKLGDRRRRELIAAASVTSAPPPWEGQATPVERQILTASRQITRRVLDGGFDAILAGVGLANLASWVSAESVKAANGTVALMAEIGMYGYTPQVGDPFIFSHRNLPTSTILTDVMTTLGALVGGPGTRSLGVLGAGEVDSEGNTASTYSGNGQYLVGSGGANDIATGADEVLLTVSHQRLVPAVRYVTSPGLKVASIVSSRGVFERDDDQWVLRSWIAPDGEDLPTAVAAMRADSSWPFSVAGDAAQEPEPTAGDLALLRSFDPGRVFLRP